MLHTELLFKCVLCLPMFQQQQVITCMGMCGDTNGQCEKKNSVLITMYPVEIEFTETSYLQNFRCCMLISFLYNNLISYHGLYNMEGRGDF